MDTPKRQRPPNPINQGEYTYSDCLREEQSRKFSKRYMDFRLKFANIPPGEMKRWKRIDKEAKARYDGPTEWDIGHIEEVGDYHPGNMFGLDYYLRYYDLTDEEAITRRLEDIRKMAQMMEERNRIYLEYRKIAKNDNELLDLIERRGELFALMIMGVHDRDANFNNCIIALTDIFYHNNGQDRTEYIHEYKHILQFEIQCMEAIVGIGGYEDLKDSPYAPIINTLEAELSEEEFNRDFGAFMMAHEGEGYKDALVRMARGTIWNLGVWEEETATESMKHIEQMGAEGLERITRNTLFITRETQEGLRNHLEEYRKYAQSTIKEISTPKVTTTEMAKKHPFAKPDMDLISHDYFSQNVGTDKMKGAYQTTWDNLITLNGKLLYRREREGKPEIKNIITITNLRREVSPEDMALLCAIASLQAMKNPEAYRNKDLEAPLYVSENELISYYYSLVGKEPTAEQKKTLSDWVEEKATHRVEIDFRQTIQAYPELLPTLSRNFNEGQIHAGIIGGYDLPSEYVYSENARKTRKVNKDGSVTYVKERTKWYYFPKFPITIYYSMVLNQSSLLDPTIRETPTLWEDDKQTAKISQKVICKLDEVEKGGLKIWKMKNGKRYISLNKSQDFPRMKWVILSDLEMETAKGTRSMKTGQYTMSLDEVSKRIWKDAPKSSEGEHRKYIVTYLIYLMNNPNSMIEDMRLIKQGKKQAHRVIIYFKKKPKKEIESR